MNIDRMCSRSRGCPALKTFLEFTVLGIFALTILSSCAPASGIVSTEDLISNVSINTAPFPAKPDGIYKAEYTVPVPSGVIAAFHTASVKVRYAGGRVSEVLIVEPDVLVKEEKFIALRNDIAAANSLNVDLVSGASYTSLAILKAVEKAVRP